MTAMERILPSRSWQFPLWFLFLLMTCSAAALAYRTGGTGLPYRETQNHLDVAIAGPGFLQVQDESGQLLYTRDGRLRINADGLLVVGRLEDDLVVQPPITIPSDVFDVVIRRDGQVQVMQAGSGSPSAVGQLQLATFIAPTGLLEVFPGFFTDTDKSGANQIQNPQVGSPGVLLQGMLNVNDSDVQFRPVSRDYLVLLLTIIGGAFLLAEVARLRIAVGKLEQRIKNLPGAD